MTRSAQGSMAKTIRKSSKRTDGAGAEAGAAVAERDGDNGASGGRGIPGGGKSGGKSAISIDAATAEERYALEPVDQLTPERLFERRWAMTLLDQTLAALQAEHEKRGKRELFDALKVHLLGAPDAAGYATIGATLDMTEAAVKKTVQRLRGRYKELLREQIAQTVATPAEVDEEIRELFKALG